MSDIQPILARLGQHLRSRRPEILQKWQTVVQKDPQISSGDSLPRAQLIDHLPGMLEAFEQVLMQTAITDLEGAAQQPGAAHGLQRWRQGYNLREVTRELGKLNECLVAEMDAFAIAHAEVSAVAMAVARQLWASISSAGIEQSVGQYFELQKREASGEVHDLENAMREIKALELQRADLWRQAAHDLRGNLSVVANATVGLTHTELRDSTREEFVRILMRNVQSLQGLLDDMTSLARLQAGREIRRIEPVDVSALLQQLCEGIRALAQQRRLFLRWETTPEFTVEGDATQIRRIAQNLILNAVKFTHEGGITVRWGESDLKDPKRWMLSVEDTGPGIEAAPPIAEGLEATAQAGGSDPPTRVVRTDEQQGEGIGLSIVKRLCELLDATIEVNVVEAGGTRFRVYFPRHYAM
jgi:signal transduction histidine kinase